MKPLFSESYYRENWNRFLEQTNEQHYINLESEMEKAMRIYNDLNIAITDEQMKILEKHEAQKISAKCEKICREDMAIIKNIKNKKASLGYTTERQEIEARGKLQKRFEFNCLQLADFKKKYEL